MSQLCSARVLSPRRDSVGAVMVEHVVILPLLLIFLTVALDMLRISYNSLSTQFIAARVLREASTGLLDGTQVQTRVLDLAGELSIPLAVENVSMCPITQYPCSGVSIGGAGEVVVLRIDVPIRGFLFGDRIWQLSAERFNLNAFVASRMEPN